MVRDLVVNDIDRLPWFYKRYQELLPRIDLPAELPTSTASAVDVLAGTAGGRFPLEVYVAAPEGCPGGNPGQDRHGALVAWRGLARDDQVGGMPYTNG